MTQTVLDAAYAPVKKSPWNANIHYHGVVLSALPGNTARVLDVGCGDGMLAAELVDAGVPQVSAVDVDRPVLERAKARHQRKAIDWIHGDVLELAFDPGSFDAVVSVATLHHMDTRRALARFAELVRPGGAVVVIGLASPAWYDLPFAAVALAARLTLRIVRGEWRHTAPMRWPPPLNYGEIKTLSAKLLPGVRFRRHLLGRYSLVWYKPIDPARELADRFPSALARGLQISSQSRTETRAQPES